MDNHSHSLINSDPQQALNLVLELEGLIRSQLARETADPQIASLINQKLALLTESTANDYAMPTIETEVAESAEIEQIDDAEPDASPLIEAPEEARIDAEAMADAKEMEPEVDDELEQQEQAEEEMEAEAEAVQSPNELKRMFTINDRFRFRRELFANNDALMSDTLNMIVAMRDVAEVTDYLTTDLGWDPESQEAGEFLDIVARYFDSRKP